MFSDWLREQDRKFSMQNRNVAILIDNCLAHPHVQSLRSVKLVFLPPNTTSKTQPFDQGIIANLKHHYRALLLQIMITEMEKNEVFNVTVLQAMRLIHQAWNLVKPSTITSSFAHCGFITSSLVAINQDNVDKEIPGPTSIEQLCNLDITWTSQIMYQPMTI